MGHETGLFGEMLRASEQAREALWTTTNKISYGYESTLALKAMLIVARDIDFAEKQSVSDVVNERTKAITMGYVPFVSIEPLLLVYMIRPRG